MEDKNMNNSAESQAEAKRRRIEEKNERIRQKGEAIARKNGTSIPQKEQEHVASTQNVTPEPQIAKTEAPAVAVAPKKSSFNAAAFLAAISIILLLALTASLILGILPLGSADRDTPPSLQVSNGNNSSNNQTPFIGENGNWWIGKTDTGVKAEAPNGENGKTPSIGENGNWWIGEIDTGVKAGNTQGDDSAMIEEFLNSVVIVSVERTTGTGTGTGIILTENGYIVTNYHVVENTTSIYVKLYGSAQYVKAKLISYKENDDVAVLKIDESGLRPATFVNDCSNCKIGERVYAVGAPEGTDYSWTVTQGIISSVNRELKIYSNDGTMEKKLRTIQTDASVNPGNSGGPLINSRGEVVGIVTMKLQESAGMGFALPSDGVIPTVNAIIETGNADNVNSTISSGRPLIGITCVSVQKNTWYKNTDTGIEEVDEDYAKYYPNVTFYAEEDGVYVKYTTQGMDAHGKLKAGDIITKINGTRVYTQFQLMGVLNDLHGGDTVTLTYYRNGKYYDVDLSLKEAPIP